MTEKRFKHKGLNKSISASNLANNDLKSSHEESFSKDEITANDNTLVPPTIYFSFACGGWLKYYLFGVGKAIREHDLHYLPNRFIGSSAGALTALGLTIGNDDAFDQAVQYSRDICMPEVYQSALGPFKITKYVSNCLDDCGYLNRYRELNGDDQYMTKEKGGHEKLTNSPQKHRSSDDSIQTISDNLTASTNLQQSNITQEVTPHKNQNQNQNMSTEKTRNSLQRKQKLSDSPKKLQRMLSLKKKIKGRHAPLTITVTSLPDWKTHYISEFEDVNDLKLALLASSAAFPLAQPIYFRGQWCIDGGLSDFQPMHPFLKNIKRQQLKLDEPLQQTFVKSSFLITENGRQSHANSKDKSGGKDVNSTQEPKPNIKSKYYSPIKMVTVNPFYFSKADIRPSRYVPAWWCLLPPRDPKTIDWLFDLGYNDAIIYLEKMNFCVCTHYTPNKSQEGDLTSDKNLKARSSEREAMRQKLEFENYHPCSLRPGKSNNYQDNPLPFNLHNKTFLGKTARNAFLARFLGYGNWLDSTPYVIMDGLTMIWIKFLWRRVALVLIYAEIFLKASVVALTAILCTLTSMPYRAQPLWSFDEDLEDLEEEEEEGDDDNVDVDVESEDDEYFENNNHFDCTYAGSDIDHKNDMNSLDVSHHKNKRGERVKSNEKKLTPGDKLLKPQQEGNLAREKQKQLHISKRNQKLNYSKNLRTKDGGSEDEDERHNNRNEVKETINFVDKHNTILQDERSESDMDSNEDDDTVDDDITVENIFEHVSPGEGVRAKKRKENSLDLELSSHYGYSDENRDLTLYGRKEMIHDIKMLLMATSPLLLIIGLLGGIYLYLSDYFKLAVSATMVMLFILSLVISKGKKRWNICIELITTILSLSLLLRILLPIYGRRINLKKHERLLNHSLMYRLNRHAI